MLGRQRTGIPVAAVYRHQGVHYASDAILGALVGTAVGYGVPLLHYRELKRPGGSGSAGQLQLTVVPTAGGLGVMGIF